jgi:hypothetical protein
VFHQAIRSPHRGSRKWLPASRPFSYKQLHRRSRSILLSTIGVLAVLALTILTILTLIVLHIVVAASYLANSPRLLAVYSKLGAYLGLELAMTAVRFSGAFLELRIGALWEEAERIAGSATYEFCVD